MILKKLSTVVLTVLMVGSMCISSFATNYNAITETTTRSLPCQNCNNGQMFERLVNSERIHMLTIECTHKPFGVDEVYEVRNHYALDCSNCGNHDSFDEIYEEIDCHGTLH